MTRLLRLLTVLLLMLTLPLNGMAGIDSPVEPCPMQAMGMPMMSGMDHDCCQDQAPSHASKACKVGQECKTASTLQVSLIEPALTFATPRPDDSYAHSLLTQVPADRWRPPRR
ncbi:hypothetical protein N5F23_02155 [Pseudomonas sichuanensis]|uniref:hypothetical protein n=1 Tax=Pseudomonas sichuanensis TaxID=2213015 RepID=UPI00244CFDAA|nr:hypothetical protein [Pseudomonas sichuanensis]MDH0729193.1 hypothetical protein [Pseudomonas sichuanensis]MDH1581395.1 hypothetical protein [Pseudomonas sichuanensis]MDH1593865.1 hypothetical protein [Pseudomonas sichuanensis]MDH1600025.1 hypothetical protein [Pseudomonas sichuanensis]